jgi:replication-associated recombination protein RarA
MKELGYGEEYKYAHDYSNNFAEQEFLPDAITKNTIYVPEIIQEKIPLGNFKTVER